MNPAEYTIDAHYEKVQDPPPDEAGVLSAIKATVGAMMAFIENGAGARLPRYAPPEPRS